MRAWIQRFMQGRYGWDELNRFLSILVIALSLLSIVTGWIVLNSFTLVLLVLYLFRALSKNGQKRAQENAAYLRFKGKITGFFSHTRDRFRQRKTHRFYKCPSCQQTLRVPRGKGRITIHCPKCKTSFDKTT